MARQKAEEESREKRVKKVEEFKAALAQKERQLPLYLVEPGRSGGSRPSELSRTLGEAQRRSSGSGRGACSSQRRALLALADLHRFTGLLLGHQPVEAGGLLQRVQALPQPRGPEKPEVESHQSLIGDGGQGP